MRMCVHMGFCTRWAWRDSQALPLDPREEGLVRGRQRNLGPTLFPPGSDTFFEVPVRVCFQRLLPKQSPNIWVELTGLLIGVTDPTPVGCHLPLPAGVCPVPLPSQPKSM